MEDKVPEINNDAPELLASSIVDLSDAAKKLLEGPLKKDAIVLLLWDMTKIPRRDIRLILDSLDGLKSKYVKRNV